MQKTNYIPNGGQTYMPFQDNIYVQTIDFNPLARPKAPISSLELKEEFKEKGFIATKECQHFIPKVTSAMLDWFWANMEKCYYLWAPGAHKRFSWVKSPSEYGFLNSAHMISEAMVPGKPVFGGNGIQINRLELSWFPFTTSMEHVIVEGIFNDKNELVDATIHMWEDVDGGCIHVTSAMVNTRLSEPPAFVKESPEAFPTDEDRAIHAEYEAAMWPIFLPKLYDLWKDHPDPSQNVQCNLKVRKKENGILEYLVENGSVKI
ncbi:glycogen debranching protein [Clostridium sp. PL3]|uniref:Glycogen debranching protein n=1 Tax=Clostridium thailandense TaxID=2794346 RepID=A0A949WTN6_9CLOT|nr:glycogen debranching protein [Clostridium thailandense]MBV7276411.1 glycogen debranching protein [Clostridium thailandense]